MKYDFRIKAINLRKRGLSYTEILAIIPVAKSTLSLWLRSVGLSKKQQQHLTQKKLLASFKGGRKKRLQRLELTKMIHKEAIDEAERLSVNPIFMLGTMLYWAEGSKSKETNPSQGFIFSNSDPLMIKVMIKWLVDCVKVTHNMIYFEIYIHKSYSDRVNQLKEYWSSVTGFSISKFDKIYYKQDKINTSRKNIGLFYQGQLRIKVRKSTNLNRKITGWIQGICKFCGVV